MSRLRHCLEATASHIVDFRPAGNAPTTRRKDLTSMKIGQLVRIEAKPDYASEIAALLASAERLAREEDATVTWFSFQLDATTFGVFDTFDDEQGRTAHLEGQIAAALMEAARVGKLSAAPDIRPVDLLGVKMPPAGG
jgi:quinol monooxygenase YgiN